MLPGRLGPYTLLRQIAVGGMAEIYLASVPTDTRLNNAKADDTSSHGTGGTRQVAIKVIHRDNANDPDFVRMLIDEARLSVQLNHANIVHTYDLGKEKDQYYIVMEFIDGADLFKVQQRASAKRISFPIELCAYVAREVARGLDFAHRLKDQEGRPLHIVHRDISPQNVLLSYAGAVKITDFGIAKAAHRAEQTQAGIIKGKYYYMSPEQALGRIIDRRTDVFAGGILLYEMLVGEMLYYDEDIDRLLGMVRKADISPPLRRRSDIPQALSDIAMKALRKRLDERYQTATDFAAALDGFLNQYAPRFGAHDLGQFVTKVMDTPRKGGRVSDPTMSVAALSPADARDDISPTVGLSSDQVRRLGIGVHDENSLIFQSQSRLLALLAESSSGSAIPADTDSSFETSRRRASHSGSIDIPEFATTSPRDAVHARTLRRDERKTEIDPELLEITNPLHPQGKSRRAASRNTPSGPTGDFTERLAAYQVHAALSAEPKPVRRPHAAGAVDAQRGLAFERMPAPIVRENPIDVEQPHRTSKIREPKVELTQSDLYPQVEPPSDGGDLGLADSLDAISNEATHEGLSALAPHSASAVQPAASGSGEPLVVLSPSSSSQTGVAASSSQSYSQLAASSASLGPSLTSDRAALSGSSSGRGRGLWGYVVTAVGAATFASVITWNVATRMAPSFPSVQPVDASVPVAVDTPPSLWVPDEIPQKEPPPAPLVGAETAAGGPPEAPEARGAVEDASGKPSSPEQTAGRGTLRINSVPEGAEVYVQRKLIGTTPLELNDQPLDVDVKVELRVPGYQKKKKRLHWNGKTELDVTLKLDEEKADEAGSGSTDKPTESAPAAAPSQSDN